MTLNFDGNIIAMAFGGLLTVLMSSLSWFVKSFFREQKLFNQNTATNISSIGVSVARLEGKLDVLMHTTALKVDKWENI